MQCLGRESYCVGRMNILGALAEPLMAHINVKSCYMKQSPMRRVCIGIVCMRAAQGEDLHNCAWILPNWRSLTVFSGAALSTVL